jgi:hypothetical protein
MHWPLLPERDEVIHLSDIMIQLYLDHGKVTLRYCKEWFVYSNWAAKSPRALCTRGLVFVQVSD